MIIREIYCVSWCLSIKFQDLNDIYGNLLCIMMFVYKISRFKWYLWKFIVYRDVCLYIFKRAGRQKERQLQDRGIARYLYTQPVKWPGQWKWLPQKKKLKIFFLKCLKKKITIRKITTCSYWRNTISPCSYQRNIISTCS